LTTFNLDAARNGAIIEVCSNGEWRVESFVGVLRSGHIATEPVGDSAFGRVNVNHPSVVRMQPIVRTVYVNLYNGGIANWFDTKDGAENAVIGYKRGERIACAEVTWNE
jgi:hypothetical protein